MGLFRKEPVLCDVCGEDCSGTKNYGHKKIKDGTVCLRCILLAGYTGRDAPKLTLAAVRPEALKKLEKIRQMNEMPVDLTIGEIHIDTKGRRWHCRGGLSTGTGGRCVETNGVYSLDDVRVTSVESYVVENVNTKTTSDGMGRALVGGVLAGTTGAVIGAAGARQTTTGTNFQQTHFHVHLRFLQPQELAGKDYWLHLGSDGELEQFLRWFKRDDAEAACENSPAAPAAPDTASELRRFKALLDEGLITQQDFDAKKKQLLGL